MNKRASSERPEHCPSCGRPLGSGAVIVRIDKGPWTCEVCDGRVSETTTDNKGEI